MIADGTYIAHEVLLLFLNCMISSDEFGSFVNALRHCNLHQNLSSVDVMHDSDQYLEPDGLSFVILMFSYWMDEKATRERHIYSHGWH